MTQLLWDLAYMVVVAGAVIAFALWVTAANNRAGDDHSGD